MKKLLYMTIAATAITVAAGCSGNDDDIWNSFPKSDNEFIKELNEEGSMNDHYYTVADHALYNSYDNINWEKVEAGLGYYNITSNDIWIRGKNILTQYNPMELTNPPTILANTWGKYIKEYHHNYRFYVSEPFDIISQGMKLPDGATLQSINANECVIYSDSYYVGGSHPQAYGYHRYVTTYKAAKLPTLPEQTIVFDSYRNALEFVIEEIRQAYGDTIWRVIDPPYDDPHFYVLLDSLLTNPHMPY